LTYLKIEGELKLGKKEITYIKNRFCKSYPNIITRKEFNEEIGIYID
jgi:hypothetical protein